MSTVEELIARCVSVCKVPDSFSEKELVSMVSKQLLTTGGNIEDIELISGAEVNGFKRWILLLNSVESARALLAVFSKVKIRVGQGTYTIEYQTSIQCELPERLRQSMSKGMFHPNPGGPNFQIATHPLLRPATVTLPHGQHYEMPKYYEQCPSVPYNFFRQHFSEAVNMNVPELSDPYTPYKQNVNDLHLGFNQNPGQMQNLYPEQYKYSAIPYPQQSSTNSKYDVKEKKDDGKQSGQEDEPFFQTVVTGDVEKGKKIEVSKIPQKALNEEFIRMTFEHKRLGGFDVADVEFDECNARAIIEFHKPEAVESVLQKCPIKMYGTEVDVRMYIPRQEEPPAAEEMKPNKIEVSNIPQNALNEEYIRMIFESKLFGGLDVAKVEIDEVNTQAIVEFFESQAVESVLQKLPVKMLGTEVDVHMYVPQQVVTGDVEKGKKIEVSKIPQKALNEEFIRMTFEHKRLGGFDVADVEFDECNARAIIEFHKPEAVESVLQKCPIKMYGTEVDVRMYIPRQEEPPAAEEMKPNKIEVSNIPQNALNEEYIRMIFESKLFGGLDVAKVEIDEVNTQAIVEFFESQAVDTVLQKVPFKMAGMEVKVCVYIPKPVEEQKTNKIVAANIPLQVLNEEYIRMTFESKQFGGLDVANVEIDAKNNQAIIEFSDPQVVELVLQKKSIKIAGTNVDIYAYVPEQATTDVKETTKILVSNLPSSINQEFIQMFFESRQFGGLTVTSIKMVENGTKAIVEFSILEDVKTIMKSMPISMKGRKVDIQLYVAEPVSSRTIEVRGPPEVICDSILSLLILYFENTKRSGGDNVVDSTYDPDQNVVLITFETEEVAQRVVANGSHVVNSKPIFVKLYMPEGKIPKTEPKVPQECKNNEEKGEPEPPLCTVKIKGFPKNKSRNSLQYYFEKKCRSGDGDVKIYSDDEDKEVLFAVFENEEVTQEVLKKTHRVEDCDLTVTTHRLPKPKPFYKDRVLIKGLNPATTKEGLFNFIEAKSGTTCVPLFILYHAELEGVVVVIMETLDYKKLEDVCKHNKLENVNPQLSRVPISNCILVSNLKPNVSKDTVEYYFENKRRSGGGPVDKVVMQEPKGSCFVYFNDYHVIEDVLSKEHRLSDQTLNVQVYQECLCQTEQAASEHKFLIPNPVVISDIDTYKNKFIKNSSICSAALANQLSKTYTKVQLLNNENKNILLVCTLTEEVKDCFKLAKNWDKVSRESFESFMNTIVVHQLNVLQDIWESIMTAIQIQTPPGVKVFPNKRKSVIVVVGTKPEADNIFLQVEAKIKQISDEVEKEKQKIKETVTSLKPIETSMILLSEFQYLMEKKYPDLRVDINQKTNEIIFDGNFGDVSDAKLQMYEIQSQFAWKQIEKLSEQKLNLYSKLQTKKFIERKLEQNNVKAVWETVSNLLLVYCSCDEKLTQCLDILLGSVVQHSLSLDNAKRAVLKSDQWNRKVEERYSDYEGKCIVDYQNLPEMIICCTDDIANEIVNNVTTFLSLTAIYEDEVSFAKSFHHLLEKHHSQDIRDISKELQKFNGHITHGPNYSSIKIKGTEAGVRSAKEKLKALASKIKRKENILVKPGIVKYLLSAKGKDTINTIECLLPCVMEIQGQYDVAQNADGSIPTDPRNTIRIHAKCRVYDSRLIVIAEGDLTELAVDVIINVSDEKLRLMSGLSKLILSKGGQSIYQACQNHVRDNGQLFLGDTFVCDAGNLQAKHIVHVMGPTWKDGESNEDELLTETVFKAMMQASIKKAVSMAIPAISCGIFGYPVKQATSIIVSAVKNFFREQQNSSVTKVYLCDVKIAIVDGFIDALKKEFGDKNVTQMIRVDNKEEVSPKPLPQAQKPLPILPKALSSVDTIKIKNITVSVIQGNIAQQKVDVIENTTSNTLNLKSGAVSASVLQAAGPEMQVEVSKKYPNGIKDGEVAVTLGYNLSCKLVVHGSLPHWKDDETALNALHTLMQNCLNEAQKNKHASIAFPALGTGNLGYPRDIVAKEMLTEISNFTKNNPQSSVTDVRVVLYQNDDQTIKAFKKEVSFWTAGECKTHAGRTFDPHCEQQHKTQCSGISKSDQQTQSVEPSDPDKVTLFIYSLQDRVIKQAIEILNKSLEKESYHKEFKEEVIKKMQDFQVMKIKVMAKQHDVQVKIFLQEGHIILDGFTEHGIDHLSGQIQGTIRSITSEEHNKEAAELLSHIVKWFWIQVNEKGQLLTEYQTELNYNIEQAYNNKSPTFEFIVDTGQKLIINFATMQEFPENDPKDCANVIRRGLMKESSSKPPSSWLAMTGNVLVVPLKNTDQEYIDIEKKFKDASKAQTVHKIERIQNNILWQQYQAKKAQLETENPPATQNQQYLWHGVAFAAVDIINNYGFNRSYCNTGEIDFGDGVLFSVDAIVSCNDKYSKPDPNGKKRIYYCHVLTGEFTTGTKGMRVPPHKGTTGNALYDSVTNDLKSPKFFVIFHDIQAYPDYLIEFTM